MLNRKIHEKFFVDFAVESICGPRDGMRHHGSAAYGTHMSRCTEVTSWPLPMAQAQKKNTPESRSGAP